MGDIRSRSAAMMLMAPLLLLAACTSSSSGSPTSQSSTTSAAPRNTAPANPKLAKAQALASSGDASALMFARVITKPFEGCVRPNIYATVARSVKGRQLAADELAFFEQHATLNQHHCEAYMYVFFDGQSTHRSGFTAGAVIDDDDILEVDVGGLASAPFVTYNYH